MNYIELPSSMKSILRPIDYKSLFEETVSMHSWVQIPISELLTESGLNWFLENKFVIHKRIALIFKTPVNFTGPFHVEGITTNEYAINFVLDGGGAVQWTQDELEESHRWNGSDGSRVILYKSTSETLIADSWTSDVALLNIAKKHRVISYEKPRYAISIRMAAQSYPSTFEQMADILQQWQ